MTLMNKVALGGIGGLVIGLALMLLPAGLLWLFLCACLGAGVMWLLNEDTKEEFR